MSIVKRSQSYYWAEKFCLLVLVLGVFTACTGDNENDKRKSLTVAKPETKNEQKADTKNGVADALLEGGFYQEQKPDSEELSEDSIEEPQADELIASEIPQTGQGADRPLKDPKALLEDLGFSGAEQDQPSLADDNDVEPFCLNAEAVIDKESLEKACRQISNRLASVKYRSCVAAKLRATGCSSVDGFPILIREFAPIKQREPQGRILIIGGTHGDELTSVSVTLRWIEKLNRYHSGLFHWHMVPMMNPDGVLKRAATRTNSNGVDLNRNLPSDDWERNAIKYWTEKGGKNPRRYPGKNASSEPETRWLIDEINSFKPDAIISVHAPYGVVDFDSLLLNTAPKSLGKLRLNLLGTYPGSLGNYAGINRNIPVITLELPHSWVMPSEAESTKIWEDIVSWLKKNINNDVVKN